MTTVSTKTGVQSPALDRMVDREEVLQICYWYLGEGMGDIYNPMLLAPFLNRPAAAIESTLRELSAQGLLEPINEPAASYRLTPIGKKKAGQLFAESFSDFQKQGHGECDAGCCDEDDHSRCGDDCTLH